MVIKLHMETTCSAVTIRLTELSDTVNGYYQLDFPF